MDINKKNEILIMINEKIHEKSNEVLNLINNLDENTRDIYIICLLSFQDDLLLILNKVNFNDVENMMFYIIKYEFRIKKLIEEIKTNENI